MSNLRGVLSSGVEGVGVRALFWNWQGWIFFFGGGGEGWKEIEFSAPAEINPLYATF